MTQRASLPRSNNSPLHFFVKPFLRSHMAKITEKSNGKKLSSTQSVDSAIWDICDIMRRSNCAGALQYVPELSWILFLRILDERESREAEEAEALGLQFTPSLAPPFRWRDWAAPESPMRQDKNSSVFDFVHKKLLPTLKSLKD